VIELSTSAQVAILMGTYNGERFLRQQLESIRVQTYENWFLVASDDGSADATLEILRQFAAEMPPGRVQIRNGPRQGFCQNFLSMACDPSIEADYYAFCDQDDIWFADKLEVAIKHILETGSAGAFLYSGATLIASNDMKLFSRSRPARRPLLFRNAMVQCVAGANTMVFNRSAKRLLENVGRVQAVSHDWWLYLLVSGCGGQVYWDSTPHMYYRQHSAALVGENLSLRSRYMRIVGALSGRFRSWFDQNIAALQHVEPYLTAEAKETFFAFQQLRKRGLLGRCMLVFRTRVYRQTWRGTVGIFIAAVINRL